MVAKQVQEQQQKQQQQQQPVVGVVVWHRCFDKVCAKAKNLGACKVHLDSHPTAAHVLLFHYFTIRDSRRATDGTLPTLRIGNF